MAARPSPLALKLAKQLAKEQGAHAKTKNDASSTMDILRQRAEASDQAVEELRNQLRRTSSDANALAASKTEIVVLNEQNDSLSDEVQALRAMLARLTYGGIHVPKVTRVS